MLKSDHPVRGLISIIAFATIGLYALALLVPAFAAFEPLTQGALGVLLCPVWGWVIITTAQRHQEHLERRIVTVLSYGLVAAGSLLSFFQLSHVLLNIVLILAGIVGLGIAARMHEQQRSLRDVLRQPLSIVLMVLLVMAGMLAVLPLIVR